jgi:hypothetical protein
LICQSHNVPTEIIRTKRVVTERIEFVSDGKTVASLVGYPRELGLIIEGMHGQPLVFLGATFLGGAVGVYNREGFLAASMLSSVWGGNLSVLNKDKKPVASISVLPTGGAIYVDNSDGKTVASINALPNGGAIYVRNNDEKRVIGLETTQYGGRIVVGDKKGGVIWSAP